MKVTSALLVSTLTASTSALAPPQSPPYIHARGLNSQVSLPVGAFKTHKITEFGADYSEDADPLVNLQAFNDALSALEQGDTLVFPASDTPLVLVGGVVAVGLMNSKFLVFVSGGNRENEVKQWRVDLDTMRESEGGDHSFPHCLLPIERR
jgi:hypothetical protein